MLISYSRANKPRSYEPYDHHQQTMTAHMMLQRVEAGTAWMTKHLVGEQTA